MEIPLFFGPKYKTPLFLPCDMTCKPLDVTLVSILVHDNYTHVGSRMLWQYINRSLIAKPRVNSQLKFDFVIFRAVHSIWDSGLQEASFNAVRGDFLPRCQDEIDELLAIRLLTIAGWSVETTALLSLRETAALAQKQRGSSNRRHSGKNRKFCQSWGRGLLFGGVF